MNKKEWGCFTVLIIVCLIIFAFYFGREYYMKKNEKEYIPQYIKDAVEGKKDYVKPKVYGVNEYNIVNMQNADMASIYLKDFYNLMRTDIYSAYQVLENDFRQKNFPTIEEFQNFANSVFYNENSLNIETMKFSGSQDSYVYDIITKSGINYFFTAEGVMVYRVRFEYKTGD